MDAQPALWRLVGVALWPPPGLLRSTLSEAHRPLDLTGIPGVCTTAGAGVCRDCVGVLRR